MKNMKKIVSITAVVGMLATTGAVYAASEINTPAEILSNLTGKSVESLYEEIEAGKTFGELAKEADKLDEFKSLNLEQKKSLLDTRVKEGTLTQEKADEIYSAILENQENCDGTGSNAIGKKHGVRFGNGRDQGLGKGQGQRLGRGTGFGRGLNK